MIKEYVKMAGAYRVILRRRNYTLTVDKVLELVCEAKQDFPSIYEANIEIMHYGGEYYKGTFGIEFNVPLDTDPKTLYYYKQIPQVEFTL